MSDQPRSPLLKRPPTLQEIANQRQYPCVDEKDIKVVHVWNFYDAPLSGTCAYNGRLHYFSTLKDDGWRRVLTIHSLPDAQIERLLCLAWQRSQTNSRWLYEEGKEIWSTIDWTPERVAAAEAIPSIEYKDYDKLPVVGVFQWGDLPSAESDRWAQKIIDLVQGEGFEVIRVHCHGEGGWYIYPEFVDKRRGDFEVGNDGSLIDSVVDDNFDSEDPRWFDAREYELSEETVRESVVRVIGRLRGEPWNGAFEPTGTGQEPLP